MTVEEMLEEVKRYIDRSFDEGKDLSEVLEGMKGYIESLEA